LTIHPIRIDARKAALCGPSAAMQTISDEALIARIAAHDELAMQVLFVRHHVRIYRFALRLVRNRQQAEDLVSEVFLDVWRQAAKYQGRSAVSTWLLAIARFKTLSSLRRREEEELDEAAAATIADTGDDPEVAIQKKEQSGILRNCLTRLSPQHREIVDLVYYQGMAIGAAAAIVGIPENTVKTRMFHARKRLSGLLATAGVDRIYQ
jgi:RNA polymerase sigma-70 factor, ECF subfamily